MPREGETQWPPPPGGEARAPPSGFQGPTDWPLTCLPGPGSYALPHGLLCSVPAKPPTRPCLSPLSRSAAPPNPLSSSVSTEGPAQRPPPSEPHLPLLSFRQVERRPRGSLTPKRGPLPASGISHGVKEGAVSPWGLLRFLCFFLCFFLCLFVSFWQDI